MERRVGRSFSFSKFFGSRRSLRLRVEQANFDFRKLEQIENEVKEELLRESKGFSMVRIMLYIFPLVVIFALAVIGV